MDCSKVEILLHDYIDGLLSIDEAIAMKNHLDECESCKAEYTFMKSMVASLNAIDEVEVPDGLHDRIMTRISALEPTKKSKTKKLKQLRPVISVIAATFILVVVFATVKPQYLFNNESEDTASFEFSSEETTTSDSVANMESGATSEVSYDTDEPVYYEDTIEAEETHMERTDDYSGDEVEEAFPSEPDTEINVLVEEESDASNFAVSDAQTEDTQTDGAQSESTVIESDTSEKEQTKLIEPSDKTVDQEETEFIVDYIMSEDPTTNTVLMESSDDDSQDSLKEEQKRVLKSATRMTLLVGVILCIPLILLIVWVILKRRNR